ncbi:hypothetical protein O181_034440 [Austropuccinia psidii MF-1]|uniref:Reverse transcriptase Ty1/copia-type domain-containing protein n=1 Tax=Austropuccinia psidii MF-1 TaxID=1389203 RepID=A0A9Q3HA77_9BASI|nr:hypothetical protein [Austropuccinia psidii MF-1]
MKQAGHCWWQHLSGILEHLGFTSCKVNQSLYVFQKGRTIVAIWIHIDNGVVTSNSPMAIIDFQKALCNNFEIKWTDTVGRIVGLECTFGEGEVTIMQSRLMEDILQAYTRAVIHHDCPLSPLLDKGVVMHATPFRSVVGSLTYLVSGSCPDLAFVVNYLARHSMAPMAAHWEILDHVVGYLLKTWKNGVVLCPGDLSLNLWSDAGWGGELECSQSGFILKLSDVPILWASKQQRVVALSTCAEEYIALSDLMQHLVQAIDQLTQLTGDFKKTIFCNNQAAVQVLIDNLSWKQMRYLDQAFFFVNDVICKHRIAVRWVKTQEMQADALTKRLSRPSLSQAVSFLSITGNR